MRSCGLSFHARRSFCGRLDDAGGERIATQFFQPRRRRSQRDGAEHSGPNQDGRSEYRHAGDPFVAIRGPAARAGDLDFAGEVAWFHTRRFTRVAAEQGVGCEGSVKLADRGDEAMAKTLRKPLPEDVESMHASRDEMQSLRKALQPLTRKLAARLARKRRHGRKGPLDFRNTVRHSLSYGGVPAEPKFKYPRPAKPELMVVADISGSVAAFARFTLMLVYAISGQFSKVRSFVFIDGIDEVTEYFKATEDIQEAIHRVNTEADVVWVDGHSDYGHAFEVFWERYGKDISPKTTVLLLGDARNNYHASQSWVIKEIRQKARHVYWLNPEPKSYWNTGDSIVGDYGVHTDGVYECRNLRQLEGFVEKLA